MMELQQHDGVVVEVAGIPGGAGPGRWDLQGGAAAKGEGGWLPPQAKWGAPHP